MKNLAIAAIPATEQQRNKYIELFKRLGTAGASHTAQKMDVRPLYSLNDLFTALEVEYLNGEPRVILNRSETQALFEKESDVRAFIRRINTINDLDKRRFIINRFIIVADKIEFARVKLFNSAEWLETVHAAARGAGGAAALFVAGNALAVKLGFAAGYVLDPFTAGLIALGLEAGAGGIKWYQKNRLAELQLDRDKWDAFVDRVERQIEERYRVLRHRRS
jgi:hypothetical protein